MSRKNSSIEANIAAAKTAGRQMQAEWVRWKNAKEAHQKRESLAKYAAAYTSCKVYIENYLKHLYPNEKNMPNKIKQDIQAIVADMESIERINETLLQKFFRDLDQLNRDAA